MVVQVEIFQKVPREKQPKLYQNESFTAMTERRIPILPSEDRELVARDLLRRYDALVAARPPADEQEARALRRQLAMLEALDHEYGGGAPLETGASAHLVASVIASLGRLGDPGLVIAAALWALRHGMEIEPVEPVVNALAERSNASRGREQLAAVFSLMQAVIENVRGRLGADLERSNPERPWRVLHANLAITAIRSEEPALLDAAFDALDTALPGERAAFYAEALPLSLAPGIAGAVRERIEERHRRWAAR
jgi:hypothetical protein